MHVDVFDPMSITPGEQLKVAIVPSIAGFL
jgi:hypothetical protein